MKYEELKADILSDAAPVRRLASPSRQFARLSAMCAFLILLYVAVTGLRFDFRFVDASVRYWMELGALLIIAAAAGLSALRLAVPGLSDGTRESLAILFAVILWPVILFSKPENSEPLLEGHGLDCSAVVLLFSVALAPVVYGMLLRAAPLKPMLTGFAATLFCSTAGEIALHFVCPGTSFDHLFFWHFLPAVIVPIALTAMCGKFLRL